MADEEISQQLYDQLQSEEVSQEDKDKQLKYLVDYFVSNNHIKIAPVGFMSGRRNTQTYCLSGLKFKESI